ncbi:HD domain-containing protein [soil metagenome]
MSKPKFSDIQHLFNNMILPFHEIERDMPLPVASKRNDNDAEHSWSLALLAIALAPQTDKTLDVGKVCIFSVIHDLVEIYAGDTSVWGPEEMLANKAAREEAAVAEIQKQFNAFPNLGDWIEQYERKDTPEAKFVYALDKFLNLLIRSTDQGEYFRNKRINLDRFKKQVVSHRRKAHHHPEVGKYYDELLEIFYKNPQFFAQGDNK